MNSKCVLKKDLEKVGIEDIKKRCPFVVTKHENPHVWYDARCIVGQVEFRIKRKGFSVGHGCFNEAHKKCVIFLEAKRKEI